MNTNTEINASNMAKIVTDAFMDCLYKDGEDTTGFVKVDGVVRQFGFHPQRLEEKRELVKDLLNQLPEEFKEGWSFLCMCKNKKGEQWGEHIHCEQLTALAIGLGMAEYPMPREMWVMFPGGVPYIQIKEM